MTTPAQGQRTTEVYDCLICGAPVTDYKPEFCCSGRECGCQGMPIEPCVCGDKCYDALMAGIGKTFEQRRIDAGIERAAIANADPRNDPDPFAVKAGEGEG